MTAGHIQVVFEIAYEYQDLFIAELIDWGFEGFEQENGFLKAFIKTELISDSVRDEIRTWIFSKKLPVTEVSETYIKSQNWNETWEASIEPMVVEPFWITPTWSTKNTPHGLIKLEIDPKMAFGTGYHETTRLILRLMNKYVSGGEHILDIGTGTGILAIAALKLGASKAFGFDIDTWSEINAKENGMLNAVQDRFTVIHGSFECIEKQVQYDIVFANVIREMLTECASQIVPLIKSGGYLLLSGLLLNDELPILQHPHYAQLVHLETASEGEWCALCFRKK